MELKYQNDLSQGNVTEHKTLPYSLTDFDNNQYSDVPCEDEKQIVYAKNLKRLRLNQLLGQKEMAISFNISQQSYAKMEAGKTIFTLKKIEKICKIFDISSADFTTINCIDKHMYKSIESPNLKILKIHYENLLLQKEMRIKELEIKLRENRRNAKKG